MNTQEIFPNYSTFGSGGSHFHTLYTALWAYASEIWSRQSQLNFNDALCASYDRTGFWFDRLLHLFKEVQEEGTVSGEEFSRFAQQEFPQLFEPALPPLAEMLADRSMATQRSGILNAWMAAKKHPILGQELILLNNACFGPFCPSEMAFLLQMHPRIIEHGCGSAYFAAEFDRQGGEIIAADSGAYGLADLNAPWPRALQQKGRLLIGGIECLLPFAKTHTLLVSWPQPGSKLAEVLNAYAEAGGKHFAFKYGAYLGKNLDFEVEHPNLNVYRFMRQLAADWHEVPVTEQPPYYPGALANNLFVFQRK